jgi:hypothetical protein
MIRWTAFALATLSLSGCMVMEKISRHPVQGSGKSATETRAVPGFDRITVRGAFDSTVTVGPATSLKIQADDNLIKLIRTEVRDGRLVIDSKESLSSRTPIRITITTPKLNGFAIEGSGEAKITGVQSGAFEASISGSGDLFCAGVANSVELSIAGSGDMDLAALSAKRAKASVSGSGDIRLRASESLDASIDGSGDIICTGNPKVRKSIAGSGDVRQG